MPLRPLRKHRWVISITVLWLILVASTIPATWMAYTLQNISPNWHIHNVSGSFWQGTAQKSQLLIDGHPFLLGELKWQFNPLSLLWLKPCINISTRLEQQVLSTTACLSILSGKLQLQNSQLSFDAVSLEPWLIVRLRGDVDMQITSIVMKNEHVYEADGVITWRQAQFHNSQTWVDLGNLQARLTDDETGGLLGRINEAGQGPLITDLTIAAPKEGGIKVSGDIIPKNTAQPAIHDILQIIGKSDNQGRYSIEWQDG